MLGNGCFIILSFGYAIIIMQWIFHGFLEDLAILWIVLEFSRVVRGGGNPPITILGLLHASDPRLRQMGMAVDLHRV